MLKELLKAVLAGIVIAIGGSIYLLVDNTIVGSLLFSIGLFCVCAGSLNLFTGKVSYALVNNKKNNAIILVTFIGNLIGTNLYALLLSLTRNMTQLSEKAISICDVKTNDTYLSLFVLGIVCNIFIYIGVSGYKNIPHEIGKYLALILSVMGFILCKSEHVVADMFYVAMANKWSMDMAFRILIIGLGNATGGILAHTLYSLTKNKD